MTNTRDEYVPFADLVRQLGCHHSTLRRRLHAEGVGVWQDPSDHRRKLIARGDAEALLSPKLVAGGAITA